MPAMTLKQRAEARSLNTWSFASSRVVASTRSMPAGGPMRVFIPACDTHAISFEETSRVRGTMAALNGLLIVASIFLAIIFLATYASTATVSTTVLFWLVVAALGAVCTYRLAGPSALERAVSVLDVTSDMSRILLKISNREYAEELLRLNPMAAERAEPSSMGVIE